MIIFNQKEYSLFSRGLRFFKELKKIGKLPITLEEFSKLMILEISKKRDDPEYKKLSEDINSYYNSQNAFRGLIKIGKGLIGSWSLKKNINPFELKISSDNKLFLEGVKFSYDSLSKLPIRYILDSLGAGGFGVVFEYPFGRIEKISYQGFVEEEMKFYKYLLKHPLSIFPKIYTLEKDQVVMEKVDVDGSPKLDKYKEWIEKYTIKISPKSYPNIPYKEANWKLMKEELGEGHEFYKFIKNVESELEKIYGYKTIGDLSKSNIGIRPKTGEIIFFDPVGGKILMK